LRPAKTTSENREIQTMRKDQNQPKSNQEPNFHPVQSTARTPRPDKIPKSGGVAVSTASIAASSPLEPPVVLVVELDTPPLDVKGRELPLLHPAA
jgi:hypothetical protein